MEILKLKKNNILIIAAHPDDEILGCGGLIAKYRNNSIINTVFMSDGVTSRTDANKKKIFKRKNSSKKLFKKFNLNEPVFLDFPDNQMDKVPFLNIVIKIEKYMKKFRPNTIITHYENCLNIDHKITFNAVVTACRPLKGNSVKKILSFEIPSSTDWALNKGKNFQPNFYVDISNFINDKIKMLKFYKDELRTYPHSRSIKSIKSLASVRGTSSGVKYAEGFYLSRYID